MRDRTIAVAAHIVETASKALEARDASIVFADRSKVESFLEDCPVSEGYDSLELDIHEGKYWEAMRKLVGRCYVATPNRLRPDQQAMLSHLANLDGRSAEVA